MTLFTLPMSILPGGPFVRRAVMFSLCRRCDSRGHSSGLGPPLQRLVVAQDTGSAIVGAVRVDYYEQPREDALVLWCRAWPPADAA